MSVELLKPGAGQIMTTMEALLENYSNELRRELASILDYWMQCAVDTANGGFIGRIDHFNKVYPEAPKGSVLNSRILWSFSAAYNLTTKEQYLKIAERAFRYLADYFLDKEYGGVYWTVDHKGQPLDTKKQIYALAFAVYGLSEYYKASSNNQAKEIAIRLYKDIVKHSYDSQRGGYMEALSREWKEVADLRLSSKDANEKKSMNTHLHVLEGFGNLYHVWPDEELKKHVAELVSIFRDRIISNRTNHLVLFFDEAWNEKGNVISYGHDIEAAWLLQEAAQKVEDSSLWQGLVHGSMKLAQAAAEGLEADGGLWYEYDSDKHHLVKEKHSWPQAEAMVGFFHAWEISGDEKWLKHSLKSWQFVQRHIHDRVYGEWKWGVKADYSTMSGEDKVGIWKCPYHNSRACIEIIQRINRMLKKEQ
jgi:cellobiose epimerase